MHLRVGHVPTHAAPSCPNSRHSRTTAAPACGASSSRGLNHAVGAVASPQAPYSLPGETPGVRQRLVSNRQWLRPTAWSTAPGKCAGAARRAVVAASAAQAQNGVDAAVLQIADGLPIRECLEEVLTGLDRSSGMVLQAPPGAGKTTVVPLALLRHNPEYLRGSNNKILVLEPRRVAAKGAARRMAASLRQNVGGTVGYRVRLDTKVSAATRIEVVTEGILLRRLQHDPELEGVGAVVFDEFHERNLDADVALALCADVQRLARPDLRLVVMSATLGGGLGDRVQQLLAEAAGPEAGEQEEGAEAGSNRGVPLVVSEGRCYPVTTKHLGRPDATERGALERAVADAVTMALRDGGAAESGDDGVGGDVLVFVPGVGEIRNVERLLMEDGVDRKYGVRLMQLHGNMAPDEQDEVLRPQQQGNSARERRRRRVILSTPIAESSVTIDGVTAVVDSGLRRAPRYDPSTAINRLETIRISEASAEQRRGRAGRTAPGRCYRLWSERDSLPAVSEPEILTADLAPTALELALWGSPDGSGLPWLDPPPADLMEAGRELLLDLGAVEAGVGRPTPHGRLLARLGVHPRWGHAVLRGASQSCAELAAVVATMLGSERDVLRGGGGGPRSADIMLRLEALARDDRALDYAAAKRIIQGARSMAAMATATVASAKQRATSSASAKSSSEGNATDDEDAAVAAALGEAGAEALESADASEDEGDAGPASTTTWSSAAPPAGPSGRGTGAASSAAAFDAAWREQLSREGLVGALVAAAYPDRIAERKDRSNKRAAFTLSSGQVVRLPSEDDPLASFEYVAVAEIGGVGPAAAWRRDGGGNDSIRSAAGLSSLAIKRYLSDMIQDREVVFWASGAKQVLGRRQKRLGCLVLSEQSAPVSDDKAMPALLKGFKEMGGIRAVSLSKEVEAWRQRVIWLRTQAQAKAAGSAAAGGGGGGGSSTTAKGLAALPDLSDTGLLNSAAKWLAPHLSGARSKSDMLKLQWGQIIKSLVPWELQQLVEAEAPTHLMLPTGTRALVDYSGDTPCVRCKLQEVFGLPDTPRLAGGRIPLTLELLSPGGQPAAVTSDLASFWRNSYPDVRKDLRGRYPKHVWPEDPLQAEATRMTKKGLERQKEREQVAAAAAGGKGGSGGGGGLGAAGKGGSGSTGKAGVGSKKKK